MFHKIQVNTNVQYSFLINQTNKGKKTVWKKMVVPNVDVTVKGRIIKMV